MTENLKEAVSKMEEELFQKVTLKTKAELIEEYRHINVEDDHSWIEDRCEWKELLRQIGFTNVDIRLSGFWNQGDGASFTGNFQRTRWQKTEFEDFYEADGGSLFTDLEFVHSYLKAIDEEISKIEADLIKAGDLDGAIKDLTISVKIKRTDSRYCHEHTVRADDLIHFEGNDWNFEDLASEITNFVREISRRMYRDAEKDYQYLTTDEAVWDTLVANDFFCYEPLNQAKGSW
jgi:hypothetical protein